MSESYIIILGPSQFHDLLKVPTPEDMARWDWEIEWENMTGEKEIEDE